MPPQPPGVPPVQPAPPTAAAGAGPPAAGEAVGYRPGLGQPEQAQAPMEVVVARYCPACGSEAGPGYAFCAKCGSPLPKDTATVAVGPPEAGEAVGQPAQWAAQPPPQAMPGVPPRPTMPGVPPSPAPGAMPTLPTVGGPVPPTVSPGPPAGVPGVGPAPSAGPGFDPLRPAQTSVAKAVPVRRGPPPFVPIILSGLLATAPWAVVGLLYSFKTGAVGTELLAIIMWAVVAVAAGASTATSPEESYKRPAIRSCAAIGILVSLAWGLAFYLTAEKLTRQGMGAKAGWFDEPFTTVLVTRLGNLAMVASGILGLIKGAIVGSTTAAIYERLFASKQKSQVPPPPPPTPAPTQ